MTCLRLVLVLLLAWGLFLPARNAGACQRIPPDVLQVQTVTDVACVEPDGRVRLDVTVTNMGGPVSPPYYDDFHVGVSVDARLMAMRVDEAVWPPDNDADGIPNHEDNCPFIANPAQADQDADESGDACDSCPTTTDYGSPDYDRDGIGNACDNCPFGSNPDQLDGDANGVGDACEGLADADGDGIPDLNEDAGTGGCGCHPQDADTDDDGIPDGLEVAPHDARHVTSAWDCDTDGDGLADGLERGIVEPVADPDGAGPHLGTDLTATCEALGGRPAFTPAPIADSDYSSTIAARTYLRPLGPAILQWGRDSDGDGCWDGDEDRDRDGLHEPLLGETDPLEPSDCPLDSDEDGWSDGLDNCPTVANPAQEDGDDDQVGDVCDLCPSVWDPPADLDGDGRPDGQRDQDGDGIGDVCDPFTCQPLYPRVYVGLTPSYEDADLDNASSPFADGPSTATFSFLTDPVPPGEGVIFSTTVSTNRGRVTPPDTCVPACEAAGGPFAVMNVPTQVGDAGESLDFELQISAPEESAPRALTVKLVRENLDDALDLFPVDPPELVTTGVEVPGDQDTSIAFSCGLHGPCFPGVTNKLHAEIRDADSGELLYDSRSWRRDGAGAAIVDRAPFSTTLAADVLDDGGDGALMACEHGFVRVLVAARNPWIGADLEQVLLEMPLPSGLTLVDSSLHFHDNPMDAVEADPSELDTGGNISVEADRVVATVDFLEPRFDDHVSPAPRVFRDLFELELLFETPATGLGPLTELTIPGPRMEAIGPAGPVGEQARGTILTIEPVASPAEAAAGPDHRLRVAERGSLSWGRQVEGGAESFSLHRAPLSRLRQADAFECIDGSLPLPGFEDSAPVGDGLGWAWLVGARNCGGDGPLGPAGRREPPSACP